ncbi:MAG: DEAD/DEAH box helicase [Gemmataceae bacterium]
MLREEQIDIRRKRAAQEGLQLRNLGRNRVFSDFLVTNPSSGGSYHVSIRGFDIGDNTCDCPDYRTNTLQTCKHIEAVLAALRDQTPEQVRRKKAAVTRPEIYLRYGEQLRIGLHLPPRPSDPLRALHETFFDLKGLWKGGEQYDHLIEAVEKVPESVTIFSDAMEFMEREMERREMARREEELLAELDRGEMPEVLRDLLTVPLHDYQLRGAIFAACRGRAILGDDMGLGKTVQTLAAVEILARERGLERVLVVAPASVKYQWETEIRRFTHREVQVIEGLAPSRRSQYAQPAFYRLLNYEQVVRDLDEINAWQPDLIVLDEAQRIRNWEAKTSRAVKKLRGRHALVLTGTPLENKLEELYSIVQFVDDRRLGPAFQFLHDHRVLDEDGKLLGYRNLEAIRERLRPIFLRRTRDEVLSQLPARTDTTVFLEMADQQRAIYTEHLHILGRLLRKKTLGELDRRRILAGLTNLRMVCGSTWLLDRTTRISPKMEELEQRLRELLALPSARKVVVFSQWELLLRQAAGVVDRLGLGYALLHGTIPGSDRRHLLTRFREDPACRVFLSTDAGGTGLNLQVADTIINLEVPWNPAVLAQRVARVHRLGQHRPVQVIHLVMRDTIEERVQQVAQRKQALFEELFTGEGDLFSLEALDRQPFLEAMRELVEPVVERPGEEPTPVPPPPPQATPQPEPELRRAMLALLDALAAAVGDSGVRRLIDTETGRPALLVPLPDEERLRRGAEALQSFLKACGEDVPRSNRPDQ